jgi:hypothetical protein
MESLEQRIAKDPRLSHLAGEVRRDPLANDGEGQRRKYGGPGMGQPQYWDAQKEKLNVDYDNVAKNARHKTWEKRQATTSSSIPAYTPLTPEQIAKLPVEYKEMDERVADLYINNVIIEKGKLIKPKIKKS